MEGMDVLRVASTGVASLAKISANFSFCCPFPKLPVESPIVVIFWLPIEVVFPDLGCLAGGAFSLTYVAVKSILCLSSVNKWK